MTQQVHIIPVGFDFQRLIFPISKGDLEADRVVIVDQESNNNDEQAAELAGSMVRRLEEMFDLIDVEVELRYLESEELYDYERLYPFAYGCIWDELQEGNEVFVNISSMPRTVAFAFATAADSIIAEWDMEYRDEVHTYYVAPERYLVTDMIEEIDETIELLSRLNTDANTEVQQRLEELQNLRTTINRSGVTEGARTLDNGKMYVEFPASPSSSVQEFEEQILTYLHMHGKIRSTSQLAEGLADSLNVEFDNSFRSRVQYNVTKLDERGYIERESRGNRTETSLSTIGKLWVETHQQ